jgi:protein-tyrosine phosphatase
LSFLSNIFNKKDGSDIRMSDPFINPIKVEFHSHLIHGVDDGSQSLEHTLDVLKVYSEMGYEKVITTPHVMSDYYKNGPENVLPKVEEIRQGLADRNIQIQFEAAAEYMVDEGLEDKIKNNETLLTFGGTNKYILIELPFMTEPRNFKKVTFDLFMAGYKPVLAHPERYLYYSTKKKDFEEIADRGILLQANILSMVGYYSKQVEKAVEYLIENKLINFVGSDLHHIKHAEIIKNDAFNNKLYRRAVSLDLLNNTL